MPLSRRQLLPTTALALLAGGGALAGCSGRTVELDEGDALRMRVWSEAAAAAYEDSLAGFTAETGLRVEVEVLAWDDYWNQLPLDVAAGSLPDVLWMNTAQLSQIRAGDTLLELEDVVGRLEGRWVEAATDLYRDDDGLWGVPQIWEQSMLVVNEQLLEEAGADAEDLSFDPYEDSDPLRELARALTVDEEGRHPGEDGFDAGSRTVHGFSAHPDRSAILGPFLAGLGGRWQDSRGRLSIASAEGVASVQYLADLAAAHLAPAASETVEDPQLCRDLFVAGKLGLLQTGTYDLHVLAEKIDGKFPWRIQEVVAGPEGTRPLVHAIAAVGVDPDDDDREKAIGELLRWIGGSDGQRPLAENRLGIPAHEDLRRSWEKSWESEGVDLSDLPVPEDVALPEHGDRSSIATATALPIIAEVFLGEAEASEAVPRAQQEARDARG